MRHILPIVTRIAVAACVLLSVSNVLAEERVVYDRWYSVALAGQHVGYAHDKVTHDNNAYTTRNKMEITIQRGEMSISMSILSIFVETEDGTPRTAATSMQFGGQSIKQLISFQEDGIRLRTVSGDGPGQTEMFPKSDIDWLPPYAAIRHTAEQLAKGVERFEYWTIDAIAGVEPFLMDMIVQGRENVEVVGKVVSAHVLDAEMDLAGDMVNRMYVDDQGLPVKMTMTIIPGMDMLMMQADEQIATAKVQPLELLKPTLLKLEKPLKNPRKLRSAIYELTFDVDKDGNTLVELPQAGAQRVVWGDAATCRVVIDIDEPVPPGDDVATEAHTKASAMLNSDDTAVRELVNKALKGLPADATPFAKAERLRVFVHEFINEKDLSVGFASASDVARTGQGDCTEHAVLLAAMLRVADIPSRTVSGVIYVDRVLDELNLFGYHMWTQAWLEGDEPGSGHRWVDLDATLERPFDAAHIALMNSTLGDGTMVNDLFALTQIIGRLKIRVIEPADAR